MRPHLLLFELRARSHVRVGELSCCWLVTCGDGMSRGGVFVELGRRRIWGRLMGPAGCSGSVVGECRGVLGGRVWADFWVFLNVVVFQ